MLDTGDSNCSILHSNQRSNYKCPHGLMVKELTINRYIDYSIDYIVCTKLVLWSAFMTRAGWTDLTNSRYRDILYCRNVVSVLLDGGPQLDEVLPGLTEAGAHLTQLLLDNLRPVLHLSRTAGSNAHIEASDSERLRGQLMSS